MFSKDMEVHLLWPDMDCLTCHGRPARDRGWLRQLNVNFRSLILFFTRRMNSGIGAVVNRILVEVSALELACFCFGRPDMGRPG
jgi:hypothetical protein